MREGSVRRVQTLQVWTPGTGGADDALPAAGRRNRALTPSLNFPTCPMPPTNEMGFLHDASGVAGGEATQNMSKPIHFRQPRVPGTRYPTPCSSCAERAKLLI